MIRPAARVLAVLELLQAHRQLSGPELAQRLGVDARTLRRYVATLEDLGIPVVAERGRYGGYRLVAGFKLPPLMLTEDEAAAVALGLLAARGLGLTEAAPATASARAKLERVMPDALRQRVRALGETVTLDVAPAVATGDRAAMQALAAAARARQRVHLRYRSRAGADSAREVDPYALLFRAGAWYAIGHCHLRGGLRSFRLDRVRDVRPLPAGFGRPADFDPAAHMARSIATLPRAHPVEVLLRTGLETAMAQLGGSLGLFLPHPRGVLLHAGTDSPAWFARRLAQARFPFEVRQSPALRDALRAHAQRLLDAADAPLSHGSARD